MYTSPMKRNSNLKKLQNFAKESTWHETCFGYPFCKYCPTCVYVLRNVQFQNEENSQQIMTSQPPHL